MRISDWSSDVCSSDLLVDAAEALPGGVALLGRIDPLGVGRCAEVHGTVAHRPADLVREPGQIVRVVLEVLGVRVAHRSEERRGGKGVVSKCRSRWAAYH